MKTQPVQAEASAPNSARGSRGLCQRLADGLQVPLPKMHSCPWALPDFTPRLLLRNEMAL